MSAWEKDMEIKFKELENKYNNRTHLNLNRIRNNEEVLQKLIQGLEHEAFAETDTCSLISLLTMLKKGSEKEK